MSESVALEGMLACPRCRQGRLALQRAGWICGGCSSGYPTLGGIPWLFAEPQAVLAEWRGRLRLLLLELEREARILRSELEPPDLPALARQRLELLAAAHEDHARRLAALLAPFEPGASATGYETHVALRTRLPGDQSLTSYYVNVHRDWCWGEEENAASLELVRSVAGADTAWGRTLVLGAGAARLAYDLHMQHGPQATVALDFNPLLLAVAREVTQGGAVELYEFPIAPRTLADHAVLRTLRAPQPVRAGFWLLAGDALRPPLVPGSFDVVVTPWLIDILPEDFARFSARVNALLRPGGCWINFGSLSFAQGERALRLSTEEALAQVEQAGFAAPVVREATLPYMRSPASRHSRLESVLAWCARKERAVESPGEFRALPEWLERADLPVPLLEDFKVQALSTRIYAFLMSLIDGRRSVRDMAAILAEQRLMTRDEAEPAIRTFLTRMYEDSRRRDRF